MKPEVKLLSLQMYKLPGNIPLASLNVISNTCVTLGDFASCEINNVDTHGSKLRILVFDLEEGESRNFECTANTLNSFGSSKTFSWQILIRRVSKYSYRRISFLTPWMQCTAMLIARDFFLVYFYPSDPFTCIFPQPLPIFTCFGCS